MKYLNKSIYALALAGMMGLWSCQSEDVLQGGETTAKGHTVPVTLTVSRGDAQTRTILSENNATGGLNDVWESGDKLAVYNADGVKAGELVIGEGVGTDTGVFTGTVTSENGQKEFNLWYTDPEATGEKEADGKPIYFNSKNEMVVDLSKMPKYTSVKALSAMDILSKKVTLNIKDNNATLVKDEKMVAHLAMARFSLNGIPTGKTGTLTIRDNGSTGVTGGNRMIKMTERLSLANSEVNGTSENPSGIIINNVKSGEDIYLAFIPSEYTLSFHMKFDGVNYDYAFTNSTELKAGVYYNAFTKAEGADEGKIDGVNIPLQKEILAELHVVAAYTGADPEKIIEYKPFTVTNGSPKAVFLLQDYDYYVENYGLAAAPAGYTFKGWSQQDPADGVEDVDSESISITSYEYNKYWIYAIWEKEVVDHSKNPLALWAESDLTRDGSGASVKGKFTGNYKTSGYYYQFGRNYGHQSYTAVNNNYSKIYVAKINSSWTGGSFTTSQWGTVNASTLSNVYNGSGKAQTAQWYTSSTQLSKYPEYFLVAGNHEIQNWNGEYVFDSSKRHNQTWAERAKDNGYTSELCPDNYRLPTLADWKKILPKGGHVYSTGATSNFATISEIKEDGDIKYAIRWSRVTEGSSSTPTQYLKIDALVVSSETTTTDGINWSDSNVVTRYFKGAGMIRPFFYLAQLIAYDSWGTRYESYQWLERAIPEGLVDSQALSTGGTTGAVQVSLTRNDSWIGGYYWVDDANHYYMNFRFDPNNLQEQGSFIQVYQPEVPIACNIRCIHK